MVDFFNAGADRDEASKGEENSNTMSNVNTQRLPKNELLRQIYHDYMEDNERYCIDYTRNEVTSLNLMSLLRRTNAPLSQYKEIMHWHLTSSGKLDKQQRLSDCTEY